MTNEPIAPTVFFIGNNHPEGQVLCADGEFRTIKTVLENGFLLEKFFTFEYAEQQAKSLDPDLRKYFVVYISSSGSFTKIHIIQKQKS